MAKAKNHKVNKNSLKITKRTKNFKKINKSPLSQTTKRTHELVKEPIKVKPQEFDGLETFEELTKLKLLKVSQTGRPFTQDLESKNGRLISTQFTYRDDYQVPDIDASINKTKDAFAVKYLSGMNDAEHQSIKEMLEKRKVKKKKTIKQSGNQPKTKVTYDKTEEEIKEIKRVITGKTKGSVGVGKDGSIGDAYMTDKLKAPKQPVDVSAWDELFVPEPIKKALSEMGFSKPTEIQRLTIPSAIKNRSDILGAAETGSGKTLAFGIPIIAGMMRDNERAVLRAAEKVKLEELRSKTAQAKEWRREAMHSDEEIGSASEESSSDEEWLGGADGVEMIDYDALKNMNEEEEMGDNESSGDESVEEEDLINNEEGEEEEGDCESVEEEELDISEGDEDDNIDEDNNSDDEDDDDEHDKSIVDNEDDYSEENADDKAQFDEEMEDKEEFDEMGDDEDMEESDEKKSGCVKVLNNVDFSFMKNAKKKPHISEAIDEDKCVRALVLTPTRELAVQIYTHLSRVCKNLGIKTGVIVGGFDARKQTRLLYRTRPQLLVATPGRLWDLVQGGDPHLANLHTVRYLAIDEADRLIDRKNFEEVHKLVKVMNSGGGGSAGQRQTFIFSATLTMVHGAPERLKAKNKMVEGPTAEKKLKDLARLVGTKSGALVVDVTTKQATAVNLTECKITCEMGEKDMYLYYFLRRHPGRTMVFCNSIEAVRRLKSIFTLLRCEPLALHASMHQKQRLKSLQQFTARHNGLLVSTDVASRGLDIPSVQHIIHFQVPFTAESYVHRSGRTARGEHSGLSIIFIEPKDLQRFRAICATLRRTNNAIPTFPVDEHLYDQFTERVKLAVAVERMQHKEQRAEDLRKEQRQARGSDGLGESDDEDTEEKINQEDVCLLSAEEQRKHRSGGIKAELKYHKKRLDAILARPVLGSMFSFNHPKSRAAMAAAMGTDVASIPNRLVGINPTQNIFGSDHNVAYREQNEQAMYGETHQKSEKVDIKALLNKERNDMAKLTRKLLKSGEDQKKRIQRLKEIKTERKAAKSKKKRDRKRKARS